MMTEREQFEGAMLAEVIMPRPHLAAHIETIFERHEFGDCGYKQMWLDSAWIGWQAARATPALPQGVLDYGYSELFWAIAAAVEKTEPNVPRKISVRAFKEKLLSAPSDGVGSGTALPQGVEEWVEKNAEYSDRVYECHAKYQSMKKYVAVDDLMNLLSGMAIVPVEPTPEMLVAARDWSYKKYGQPIGNDAAKGCWQAILAVHTAKRILSQHESSLRAKTGEPNVQV